MPADQVFEKVTEFAKVLRDLRAQRRSRVISVRQERAPPTSLTRAERTTVLSKTDGRCHICGGTIDGHGKPTTSWRAPPAENTQWTTIFQPTPSATITDGIMMPRSFSGFSKSGSGCEPKSKGKIGSVGKSDKNSANTKVGALNAANVHFNPVGLE
jgi:hypothetical protein